MAEITLAAEAGRPAGSRAARRLRSSGKVPGVIYGHGMQPLPVAVDGRDLRHALTTEAGLNALLALHVDGTTHLTLAREIQRHPVRGTVSHVDFLIVRRDEVVAADVPVTLIGEAEELHRADGILEQQLFSLTVRATPVQIPSAIEVDVSALKVGDAIRVGDLRLPSGVMTEVHSEEVVVVGQPPAVAIAEEVAEAAEGAEAEAAGAGAGAEAQAAPAEAAGEHGADATEASGGGEG
jgi:large subunit ribosomal protein L25